ncbi:MAG: hypothetical protein RIC38_04845 [Chromatocurvus sp.]
MIARGVFNGGFPAAGIAIDRRVDIGIDKARDQVLAAAVDAGHGLPADPGVAIVNPTDALSLDHDVTADFVQQHRIVPVKWIRIGSLLSEVDRDTT